MPAQEGFHLREVDRLGIRFRERHVDVVVEDHDQPGLGGELEDAIEGGVGKARRFSGDLRGDELLVDAELADPGEHAGKRFQHAANVVDAIHVGRVEPRDHRVEPRLVGLRQSEIHARDVGVGEGVVVERRVGLQVIRGREVARVRMRPLLLQWDSEQCRPSDASAHDAQESAGLNALLDVVRQMEMRIVKAVGVGRLGVLRRRRHERDQHAAHGDGSQQLKEGSDATQGRHLHSAQKLISRLMWNTGPLAPTGYG